MHYKKKIKKKKIIKYIKNEDNNIEDMYLIFIKFHGPIFSKIKLSKIKYTEKKLNK